MHNNYKKLKRTNKLIARNYNLTQQTTNLHSCNPPRSCKRECTPACSSDQICIYKIVTECGTCSPTYCTDSNQLQISATDFEASSDNDTNQQAALIAGLTTGLVVLALIAVTVAGFVFHRRRKLQKILLQQQQEEEKAYIPPHPPIIISDINSVLPPPPSSLQAASMLPPISEFSTSPSATPISNHWHQEAIDSVDYDHPQSPFIIGAQSLQIPHLDTPDPSSPSSATLIRRSLNIQPTIITDNGDYLSRASSVKVTKYDNRPIPITKRSYDTQDADDQDDDDEKGHVTIRRAVSVKKNNSTASHSSSITRVGSITSEDVKVVCAKPTMVRINTITSKEGGITRKRSIRTVIDQQQQPPFQVSLHDPSEDDQSHRIDVYFCPPAPPPPVLHNPSQVSIQSSNSSSTIGDGEITVFWEPGHQLPP